MPHPTPPQTPAPIAERLPSNVRIRQRLRAARAARHARGVSNDVLHLAEAVERLLGRLAMRVRPELVEASMRELEDMGVRLPRPGARDLAPAESAEF